jgi:hypothetical protein
VYIEGVEGLCVVSTDGDGVLGWMDGMVMEVITAMGVAIDSDGM